jgi:hypothetical protein
VSNESQWQGKDFSRRAYTIEGDDLDKAKRITVQVRVDDRVIMQAQLREPGLLAIVSQPNEQGIALEIIEPGGVRFTDRITPDGGRTDPPSPWQLEALGLPRP